ncbi:MAG: ABC transporter substrate-binding protein [Bacteroidales bacterium]|jgi:iron complex transport system substrate-binding protein|nr:ABC transporter substrate-binding protein [Bacteroidales bacterium]
MKTIYSISIFALALCTFACNSSNTVQHTVRSNNRFEYAVNLFSEKGSTTVILYLNAQKTDSVVYELVSEKPANIYDAATKTFFIHTPAQQVAVTSTTDIAPIAALGKIDVIIAVSEVFRSCNAEIQARYATGNITDVGSELYENAEKIIAIQPQLLIKTVYSTAFTQNDVLYVQAGIPIIYNNNWQEATPLGRAEWITFFGMLLGKEHEADSIFAEIRDSYNEQKARYVHAAHRPKVLLGEMVKDTWYAPGGNSYIAQFIADAGGDYLFSENNERGSLPMNFEQVLQRSQAAEVWIGSRFSTKKELFAENQLYKLLPITKTDRCYNYNRAKVEQCNDFFETGTLRPDYVLRDCILVLHGNSAAQQGLRFLQKLQ